ncbi:hypothetical protein EMIT0P253_50315 [Pseudomonas sp. IT-P253]
MKPRCAHCQSCRRKRNNPAPCRSELAREKLKVAAGNQMPRMIVNDFREQARSYNTPLPGNVAQGEKTLSRTLDMPHKWAHLRGAVVQFLESLESLCRLPLSWLPNWKSSHSSTWTVPRKV